MPNPGLIKAMVAEAAILPNRIVKFGSSDGAVVTAAAATDALIGVSDALGQDTAGARVEVIVTEIADITAGAAFARGVPITSDSQGRAIAAAPATGANVRIVGIAQAAASAAGDLVPVNLSLGVMQG